MNAQKKSQLIDFIVAIILCLGALACLLQSLKFPGRAGMWPTFVMVALLLFVSLHILILLRGILQKRFRESKNTDSQIRGG